MNTLKKIQKFLGSMQLAIVLLLILALACTGGSFITQNQTTTWYQQNYSESMAAFITLFGLDDVFHSWWFVAITVFLCVNLLSCSIIRFPSLIRRSKAASKKEKKYNEYCGIWGPWLVHLGILILIIGFGFGQMFKTEFTVYGVPGQIKQVGETGLLMTINSFDVGLREDDTVDQYTSDITVGDPETGESHDAKISVNYPASMFGMKFYQNSTGFAADCVIRKNDEIIQTQLVCGGEFVKVEDMDGLYIMLNAVYPDYYKDEEGNVSSLSSAFKNPAYLYSVYYDNQVIGMNYLIDDYISIDDYVVTFENPQYYTLIQVKKDPFTPVAMTGGLIIMIALIMSFYLRPAKEIQDSAPENEKTSGSYAAGKASAARAVEEEIKAAESNGDSNEDLKALREELALLRKELKELKRGEEDEVRQIKKTEDETNGW